MAETFGSTCHGAGRASSRNSARRTLDYQTVISASLQEHCGLMFPPCFHLFLWRWRDLPSG